MTIPEKRSLLLSVNGTGEDSTGLIVGLLIRHLQRFGVLGHVAVAVVVGKLMFRCSR